MSLLCPLPWPLSTQGLTLSWGRGLICPIGVSFCPPSSEGHLGAREAHLPGPRGEGGARWSRWAGRALEQESSTQARGPLLLAPSPLVADHLPRDSPPTVTLFAGPEVQQLRVPTLAWVSLQVPSSTPCQSSRAPLQTLDAPQPTARLLPPSPQSEGSPGRTASISTSSLAHRRLLPGSWHPHTLTECAHAHAGLVG